MAVVFRWLMRIATLLVVLAVMKAMMMGMKSMTTTHAALPMCVTGTCPRTSVCQHSTQHLGLAGGTTGTMSRADRDRHVRHVQDGV